MFILTIKKFQFLYNTVMQIKDFLNCVNIQNV